MAAPNIAGVVQLLHTIMIPAVSHLNVENEKLVYFSDEFKAALKKMSDADQQARIQSQGFQMGKPGIELHNVVLNTQKASLSLQMFIQVRNKLVETYQSVINMPI